MKVIWKKPTWTNKRVLMVTAGVFVLVAVIVIVCLLLRGGPADQPDPSTEPTVSESPMPSAAPAPSDTPEPVITPPALQGSEASGSDIQVSIQQPATDSDLSTG